MPSKDIYPPNRVSDLKIVQLKSLVNISFTAPGEDNDEGKGDDINYFALKLSR